MSNVLVLGGTGFVGRHVCEQLQRAGHRMTVTTRHIKRASAVQHLPLVTGLDLLVHQAALQFALFTGSPAPLDAMRDAGRAALAERG